MRRISLPAERSICFSRRTLFHTVSLLLKLVESFIFVLTSASHRRCSLLADKRITLKANQQKMQYNWPTAQRHTFHCWRTQQFRYAVTQHTGINDLCIIKYRSYPKNVQASYTYCNSMTQTGHYVGHCPFSKAQATSIHATFRDVTLFGSSGDLISL
jgi:hypothetical protein